MNDQIKDIMTCDVQMVPGETPLSEVARIMRDEDIGNVLVAGEDGSLSGIITDRDIVVRADAEGLPLGTTFARDVCSSVSVKVDPEASIDDAIILMRNHAVRRVVVVTDGRAVGIVSLGDLAVARDPRSVLGEISASPPSA